MATYAWPSCAECPALASFAVLFISEFACCVKTALATAYAPTLHEVILKYVVADL